MKSIQISFVFCYYVIIRCETSSAIESSGYEGLIPCATDDDCDDLLEAKCEEGLCKCMSYENFVCNDLNGTAVNMLEDSYCQTNANCKTENAVCSDNKKCVCGGNMISSKDERKCFKKLGGSCVKNEECSLIEFSSCVNSKCACVDKYIASGSRCLLIAKGLGSKCVEDVQCVVQLGAGSHCFNRSCQCKELYQLKPTKNKCTRDVLLGGLCSNHNECHQPGPEASRLECILGVCKCRSLYVEYDGYCISMSTNLMPTVCSIFYVVLCPLLFIYL